MLEVSSTVLWFGVGAIFLAGIVNGMAGFGFALVGTMVLATVVDPATAVVFMIVPILAANVTLVGSLSASEVRTCGRRFAPLLGATLLGTVLGMLVIDSLPQEALRIGLGVVTLAFVATVQRRVPLPGLERATERCFVERPGAMAGVGLVSGLVFGGTNVGVQLVAYLRSCSLSHGLFVGVVAMVFVGINVVRVGVAGVLGLYPSPSVAALSVLAAVPAVAGVWVGSSLRRRIGPVQRSAVVVGLLTVVGVRLLLGGLGVG